MIAIKRVAENMRWYTRLFRLHVALHVYGRAKSNRRVRSWANVPIFRPNSDVSICEVSLQERDISRTPNMVKF